MIVINVSGNLPLIYLKSSEVSLSCNRKTARILRVTGSVPCQCTTDVEPKNLYWKAQLFKFRLTLSLKFGLGKSTDGPDHPAGSGGQGHPDQSGPRNRAGFSSGCRVRRRGAPSLLGRLRGVGNPSLGRSHAEKYFFLPKTCILNY